MKKLYFSLILLVSIVLAMTLISACYSDIECIEGGGYVKYGLQQAHKQICINGKCIWQNPISVACADDDACPQGQACSKIGNPSDWKCLDYLPGEGAVATQTPVATQIPSSTFSNGIVMAIIIGIVVIIGFIILAIVLSKRKK